MNFLTKPGNEAMMAAQSAAMAKPREETGSIRPMAPVSAQEMDRLDAMARQNGYKNYEEMRAFLLRRQMGEGGSIAAHKKPSLDAAMAWHPRNLFNYVAEAFKGATER